MIEIGLLPSETASELLGAWTADTLRQGDLRRRLALDLWPSLPDTPWGISWSQHMTSMARALQPYSHCSPDLIQWTLAFQRPTAAEGQMLAAIGSGSFDQDKAERLALLLTVFLWNLLVVLNQLDELEPPEADVLHALSSELRATTWLDAGEEWHDQLVPHVWFKQ